MSTKTTRRTASIGIAASVGILCGGCQIFGDVEGKSLRDIDTAEHVKQIESDQTRDLNTSTASGGTGGVGGQGSSSSSSDFRLKHDIERLGTLTNGLGFYRFAYNGEDKAYVGVMAQEVELVAPDAVTRGADGYLRVYYDKLGFQMQTYADWLAAGAELPAVRLLN